MKRDEQFSKNLDAAHAFLLHLLKHPENIDMIEDGSTIVHMPSADPELRQANQAMVTDLAAQGMEVRQVKLPRRATRRAQSA